jgi:hypothetical protein
MTLQVDSVRQRTEARRNGDSGAIKRTATRPKERPR